MALIYEYSRISLGITTPCFVYPWETRHFLNRNGEVDGGDREEVVQGLGGEERGERGQDVKLAKKQKSHQLE